VPLTQHLDLGRVAHVEPADLGLHLRLARGLLRFPIFAQANQLVLVRLFVLGEALFEVVADTIQLQSRAILDGGKALL